VSDNATDPNIINSRIYTITASGTPIITVSYNFNFLNNFGYVDGSGPSAEQTFTLSGSDLTNDITVTPPTNYEISEGSGGSFVATDPITLTQSGGSVAETTIYVRLKAGLSVGDYNGENIIASSTGASEKTVTCNGTVYKQEPSNHVTSFSATANGNKQIDLGWTDAIGTIEPDAYLIKGSDVSFAAITAPVDGTPEADAGLVKNVAQGVETCTITGLTETTQYFFKIFPYTNSGATIDYKTDGTVPQDDATTDAAPSLPNLVINEILADPDGTSGDANGDGTVSTTNDEFVEIVNIDGASVDISGYTVEDGFGLRHTFAASTIIPDGQSIVVFGGGIPTNIPGSAVIASTGALGLNNDGDNVILKDDLGNIVASESYGSEGGDNQSLARDPDFLGPFVKHSTITTNPVLFSPGKNNIGGTDLPVELTSFTASVAKNSVKLDWNTATEINNYGFEIQRSADEEVWNNVGFVNGNGTTNSPKDYYFVDDKLSNAGSYYYRLKQVDNDGSYEFSKTIEVVLGSPTSVHVGSKLS
jgi:hypothetical protein